MKSLRIRDIERQAEEVIAAYDFEKPPIDPLKIAQLEKIKLLPSHYDDCFDGRIEYRHREGRGKFYLFYEEEGRNEGRIRFSVAHELGHFYLPEHREYLCTGGKHNSKSGFVSDEQIEREADLFAASLLMPEEIFKKHITLKTGKVCNMTEIVNLANRVFKTSITSTAIRYVHMCVEPCCVVLSKGDEIIYTVPSEDMKILGYSWVKRGSRIPSTSVTGIAANATLKGEAPILEGPVDSDIWFEGRPHRRMWEETKVLGRTGLTLTLLSLEE